MSSDSDVTHTRGDLNSRREGQLVQGEMLKLKAAEEAADAAEKGRLARERAIQANLDTARANETLQEFKMREAEREAAAEQARLAYIEHQEWKVAERKRREAAREAEKEVQRKAMVCNCVLSLLGNFALGM